MSQVNISVKTKILNLGRLLFKFRFLENMLRKLIVKNNSPSNIFCRLVPPNYLYKINTFRNFTKEGVNLRVDISDYVGHFLYFGFEDEGYQKLFSLVKENFTVIDVGANIGFTALVMAKIAGKSGKVIAFEPDPYNYSELVSNLKLNPNSNINSQNSGLGVEKNQLKLSISRIDNRGMNRISESAETNFIKINVDSLDNFVFENNIRKIDLIKIDVEGFEYNVLKGCENVLTKFRPIFFIELDDSNLKEHGATAKELIILMNKKNYKCIHSVSNEGITPETKLEGEHFDIICLPL